MFSVCVCKALTELACGAGQLQDIKRQARREQEWEEGGGE